MSEEGINIATPTQTGIYSNTDRYLPQHRQVFTPTQTGIYKEVKKEANRIIILKNYKKTNIKLPLPKALYFDGKKIKEKEVQVEVLKTIIRK